jgi:sulfur-oxidizing protein SoxX
MKFAIRRLVSAGLFASIMTAGVMHHTVRDQERVVTYQIVNGAIPEPLTNQPGDPERGWLIVRDRTKGDCIVCHAMLLPERQFHGTVGPPLDDVGGRYTRR